MAPASKAKDANEWVHRILGEERDIVIPVELAERFKFAKEKSKLAGTIRGSVVVIKDKD